MSWGDGKKEGGGKRHEGHPTQKGVLDAPSSGSFPTPLGCRCSVFLCKERSKREQTRSSVGGVQHFFSLCAHRSSSVSSFFSGKSCGKLGGKFAGFCWTHRGSKLSGDLRSIFGKKFRNSIKIIRANFALQTCHPNYKNGSLSWVSNKSYTP